MNKLGPLTAGVKSILHALLKLLSWHIFRQNARRQSVGAAPAFILLLTFLFNLIQLLLQISISYFMNFLDIAFYDFLRIYMLFIYELDLFIRVIASILQLF